MDFYHSGPSIYYNNEYGETKGFSLSMYNSMTVSHIDFIIRKEYKKISKGFITKEIIERNKKVEYCMEHKKILKQLIENSC